jgi:UDP-N-acetylmuramyl pentapeptide phosphotransferase/UDP-N-acetylglucosamine-1-phosphate transferase
VSATLALGAGVAAFLISATAIVPLRRLALRWGLTDRPGGHKTHPNATPYLGGIAITLATIVPTVVSAGFSDRRVTAILLGSMAVAILGLIDDIASLPAATRLTVETIAASGVVLSGVQIDLIGGWLDGPLTVIWIVVVTNSFNLLDNMDGSLGTVTITTAGCLAGAAVILGHPGPAVLLAALAYAALGFLPHNWPPARIFMGDSGSLFIGFVVTCSTVLLVTGRNPDFVVAGLLLATFIVTVDTGVVLFSRMLASRPPLSGGTDHVSHRLRRLGMDGRLVITTQALVAACTGALFLSAALGWIPPLTTAIVAAGTAIVLISLLQGVDIYAPAPASKTVPPKTPQHIRERRR